MTADKAEETTAKMIEQGRLLGRMDQFDRIIWFEVGEASGQKGSGRTDQVTGKEMRRYDSRVEALAEEVESVANALQREFPVCLLLLETLFQPQLINVIRNGSRQTWSFR